MTHAFKQDKFSKDITATGERGKLHDRRIRDTIEREHMLCPLIFGKAYDWMRRCNVEIKDMRTDLGRRRVEVIFTKGRDQFKTTMGIIDLYYPCTLKFQRLSEDPSSWVKTAGGRYKEKEQSNGWESEHVDVFVEVKTENDSLFDAIAQVNHYREYLRDCLEYRRSELKLFVIASPVLEWESTVEDEGIIFLPLA